MSYTVEKVTWDTIDEAIKVEEETLPNGCYLKDNSKFFLDETKGDLTLVRKDGKAVGIGKFSILADGSGWLETLRVIPEAQNQGVGKTIYDRWIPEAEEFKCPAIRMFTGTGNVRSKGLAERYGLSLAGTVIGATKRNLEKKELTHTFKLVKEYDIAKKYLEEGKRVWGKFVVTNNTFFETNEDTWHYLVENDMVYVDENDSYVVIGARMLKERGLHVLMYGGDSKACLDFAENFTAECNLLAVTVSYPPENTTMHDELEKEGFVHDKNCRITMERIF